MSEPVTSIQFDGLNDPIPVAQIVTIIENHYEKDSEGNYFPILIIVLTNGASIVVRDTQNNRDALNQWKKFKRSFKY
jgi:hypothetical protein